MIISFPVWGTFLPTLGTRQLCLPPLILLRLNELNFWIRAELRFFSSSPSQFWAFQNVNKLYCPRPFYNCVSTQPLILWFRPVKIFQIWPRWVQALELFSLTLGPGPMSPSPGSPHLEWCCSFFLAAAAETRSTFSCKLSKCVEIDQVGIFELRFI